MEPDLTFMMGYKNITGLGFGRIWVLNSGEKKDV